MGQITAGVRSLLRISLFRNSFFLLLRSFLSSGLGFLFWLVVARVYPPDVVGQGAAVLSMLLLLARGAELGLPNGVIRFLPTDADQNALLNGAFTVSAFASVAIGLGFLATVNVWVPPLSFVVSDVVLAGVFVLSLVFLTLDGIVDNAFVAARRADYGLIRSTVFYALRVPFVLAFAGFGVFGMLSAWTVALVVSVFGLGILIRRFYPRYRPAVSVKRIRSTGVIGYSLWNYATGLVAGAAPFLLPTIILATPGPEGGGPASAFFFSAYSFAVLLYLVPSSFSTALLVEGSHVNAATTRDVRDTLRYSMPLLVLGIALTIVLGRPILNLFGARYAEESYMPLVILALASPVMLAASMYTTRLRIEKRMLPIFLFSTVSAAITLALAYVLLPILGIVGPAIGFLAGQLGALLLYAAERTVHRSRGGIESPRTA